MIFHVICWDAIAHGLNLIVYGAYLIYSPNIKLIPFLFSLKNRLAFVIAARGEWVFHLFIYSAIASLKQQGEYVSFDALVDFRFLEKRKKVIPNQIHMASTRSTFYIVAKVKCRHHDERCRQHRSASIVRLCAGVCVCRSTRAYKQIGTDDCGKPTIRQNHMY